MLSDSLCEICSCFYRTLNKALETWRSFNMLSGRGDSVLLRVGYYNFLHKEKICTDTCETEWKSLIGAIKLLYSQSVYFKVTVSSDAPPWSRYSSVGWSCDLEPILLCGLLLPAPVSHLSSSFFLSAAGLCALWEPKGDEDAFTHREPKTRGDGDASVYRTSCVRLQISPTYFQLLGRILLISSQISICSKHM